MAYEGHCGKCVEFQFFGENKKGYCNWYHTYYFPTDTCTHQKNMYEKNPSGCFLTTMICNVLGYDDDCFVLNKLRNFRDNVMQKDEKYKDLLLEYDLVGPRIAEYIKADNKNTTLWDNIYNLYIVPTTNYIMEKNYSEAVNKYRQMYDLLKEYYCVEDISYDEIKKDYDQSRAGHGKVMIKKNKNAL